jgi:hypothetical protein
MDRVVRLLPWVLAVWIAYVFVWYLQYKFTGAEGSRWLFTVLTDWLGVSGYEKPMRIGTGAAELIASILCFIRPLQVLGGAMSAGIMSGAIFFHLATPLGIDPYDDGGVLFTEAVLTLLAGLAIMWIRREDGYAMLRHVPVISGFIPRAHAL